MQNRQSRGSFHSKSSSPSTVSCPHCGHALDFFRKPSPERPRRRGRFRNSRQVGLFLRAARGSLLWFAILFTIAAMLVGAVQQNVWPMLLGIGLLSGYGSIWWFASRRCH
jgi:hypothetical protein